MLSLFHYMYASNSYLHDSGKKSTNKLSYYDLEFKFGNQLGCRVVTLFLTGNPQDHVMVTSCIKKNIDRLIVEEHKLL